MLILNGHVLAEGAPELSLLNRGFKFGDGLFEQIRIAEGKPLFLFEHLNRLFANMKTLHFDFDPDIFRENLLEEIEKLLALNQLTGNGKCFCGSKK